MRTYKFPVTNLADNQVFVFGSNYSGFHGAGSAAWASFGQVASWKSMKYDQYPDGTKFHWNIKGIGEGFQIGLNGKSYALPTVYFVRGKNHPIGDLGVMESIRRFYKFANENPQFEYLVGYKNQKARYLNGRYPDDMAYLFAMGTIPTTVIFEESFLPLVRQQIKEMMLKFT